MKHLFVLILFFLFGVSLVQGNSAMSPTVIKVVRDACVEVLVERQLRGGGAIIESGNGRAYVITAAHLFPKPNAFITIMTEKHGIHNANLIAYDFGHDLALLEIATPRDLPTIPVASYTPSPTQPVYNFGPALRRRTLIISGDMAESRVNYTDFEPSDGYLAHIFIAAINPVLTSGGIWVNQKGEVIGVQSGRLKGDAGAPSSGLSMACPPSAIRKLIKTKVSASTPGIGGWIWELWTIDRQHLTKVPESVTGLAVRWVREGGALERAGIKPNEIIVACNGEKILRRNDLFSVIRAKPSGSIFTLSVYNPDTNRTRKAKLQTMPLEARWNIYLKNLRNG
ncbi:MAG: S1C family serine protease [Verrucomicrobiales bacterium]|nr:S1C family serine protease [Verrucomicrobiales bacterium]